MRAGKMQSIAKTAEAWRVAIIPDMTCLTADTAEGLSDIWRRHDPTTEWFRYMSNVSKESKEAAQQVSEYISRECLLWVP